MFQTLEGFPGGSDGKASAYNMGSMTFSIKQRTKELIDESERGESKV